MKQLVAFFILFMLTVGFTQAQESAYEITLADRTAAATHVFTGKVKQSRAFWLEASRKIYTAHEIEVFTLYKGSLSGITLELITEGGITEDRFSIVCPSVNLQVGDQGLFFAQASAYPSQFSASAQVEIYAGPAGYIEYTYDRVNPPARGFYRSYENVEAELIAPIQALTRQAAQPLSLTEGEQRVQAWLGQRGQVATRSDWGIEYYFGYPQITGSNGQYLEFDIEARVTGGSYEYGNAEIYLEYDTVGFLSNVAASGMITVTKGDITTSSDYGIFVTDEQPDRLKIEIAAADPPIALGEVDGWLEDVIHVKIDISQLTQQIELSFESLLMDGESEYYDPASGTYAQFPFVFAYDSIAGASGSFTVAEIIEFFPDTVRAGVRDTLVIVGNDFGAVKGKVYFRDADAFNQVAYMEAPDAAVVWGANLIKVAVPSTDIGNTSPAGTGRFIVEDANGNRDTSASNLTVLYAIQNVFFPTSQTIRRANLGDINAQGGYTIQVQSSLSDTLDVSQIVNVAISDWNCATLVNFTRGTDTALVGAQVDGISLISLSNGALPGGAKTTWSGGGRTTQCAGNQEIFTSEIDIEVNPFLNWNFRDTLPTLQEKDFYTVILHELGHGHMINHVLDPTVIMYGDIPAGQRRTISFTDTLAGQDVVAYSAILDNIGCGDAMVPILCNANSIEQVWEGVVISIYPNPANSEVFIEFPVELNGKRGIIQLLDLQGKSLYTEERILSSSQLGEIRFGHQVVEGIYFLHVLVEDASFTQKIWIRHE